MTVQRPKVMCFSGAALLALSCFSWASIAQKPPVADQASIIQGQALYKRHCLLCHGEKGMGDGPATKTMKEKPPNITDKAVMAKLTDDEIFALITKGKKVEMTAMPPFERKLTEAERWQVISFVRTLSR